MTNNITLCLLAGAMALFIIGLSLCSDRPGDCYVEFDRAERGTVLVRVSAVSAIIGPGEVVLDDDGGVRHNLFTQLVTNGELRINVGGTASQAHERLTQSCD